MRISFLAAIACAMASTATAAPLPVPIAPASEGKLQCYAPNPATKSCQSLAAYEAVADGGIVNPATVLISASPSITMQTTTPVTIKSNAVCGSILAQAIEAATFTIDGKDATEAQTSILRQQRAAALKGMFGHEICTTYLPEGEGLVAKVTIDGIAQPAMDQRVLWVSLADGFRVQP